MTSDPSIYLIKPDGTTDLIGRCSNLSIKTKPICPPPPGHLFGSDLVLHNKAASVSFPVTWIARSVLDTFKISTKARRYHYDHRTTGSRWPKVTPVLKPGHTRPRWRQIYNARVSYAGWSCAPSGGIMVTGQQLDPPAE